MGMELRVDKELVSLEEVRKAEENIDRLYKNHRERLPRGYDKGDSL